MRTIIAIFAFGLIAASAQSDKLVAQTESHDCEQIRAYSKAIGKIPSWLGDHYDKECFNTSIGPLMTVDKPTGEIVKVPSGSCEATPAYGLPKASALHTTVVCKKAYVALVDDDLKVPRWVAYTLTKEHSLGCDVRVSDFHLTRRYLKVVLPVRLR